ncbi:hypothetical protein GPZ77_00215 [Streptomyces sp. QHH-9511]|uniref:FG-GAP repeat domain-containing protein n=1 Tax=Streptomyces sp. QHH-9511 TaxID=2684468 RepID=UPI001317DF91|nr:VCBS repeat-containing protein [Streptomyces sp. QHH-9511]QGZ47059.1 hypothetical protein GPZ77_00215 [Streptomyces sp. QHH-9511]
MDVPRGAENGVGPEVNESGTFKVVRSVKPHDYSDNGSPDVLTRDAAGKLWRIDTGHEPSYGTVQAGKPVETGTGWQIYDRIEATGNLSDLTGDEKPDVLATDPAGGLWLYPGTGNADAPLAPRQKMGTGWGIYNQITSTGNIGGAPAGDLVARDAAGDLWRYLGKGDGTFVPRTKIGTGWNTYSDVVAIGDANRDGRPDLIGHSPSDNTVYVYAGTGDWSVPFKGRTPTGMVGGSYNSWS